MAALAGGTGLAAATAAPPRSDVALPALAGDATAAEASSRDADLIRLCAEFDALERTILASYRGGEFDIQVERRLDAERDKIVAKQHALLERICALPCTSSAGVQALGSTLALYIGDRELEDDLHCGVDDRLMAALLRGILQGRA